MRKNAGKRYRIALLGLFLFVSFLWGIQYALTLFLTNDITDEVPVDITVLNLRKYEVESNYEVKNVDAGQRPKILPTAGAELTVPKLVDVVEPPKPIGTELPENILDDFSMPLDSSLQLIEEQIADNMDVYVENKILTPVDVVEQMPEFPGGLSSLMRWLDRNVKYPQHLVKQGVEGDVEVSFLVDKNGRVDAAFISKALHPELDSIVLAVIHKMPKWKPAQVHGKVDVVQVSIPVHFEK